MGTLDWTHLLVQAALIVLPLGAGLLRIIWRLDEFPLHKHLNGRIDYPKNVNAKARGLALYIGQKHHADE